MSFGDHRSAAAEDGVREYRVLATSKTSTMEEEMRAAADLGFHYAGQTVFSSAYGGDEVVVIGKTSTLE